MEDSKNKISFFRDKRGLTMKELGSLAGTTASQINKLEKGDRALTLNWMNRISKALGVSPFDLIEGEIGPWSLQSETKNISVIGEVQAGVWREVLEWPDDEKYPISLPINNPVHAANCYGLVVCGHAMDKVYPEGAILVVMPLSKYPNKLENGDNVIVHRSRAGVMEATVKELQIKKDKAELWPRSSNPKYAEPIYIDWPAGSVHQSALETVEITAVVIGSYKLEKKL